MPVQSVNIGAGTIGTTEAIIQSLPAGQASPQRVRIRGHINFTMGAASGVVTIKIRQGSLTGTVVYTAGANEGSGNLAQMVFEVEDTTGPAFINSGGIYVLTAISPSIAGTLNSGYAEVELLG